MGMKTKTIKSIINKKFNHWANTIEDDNVRTLVKNNTIVTGGCIASMLLGEEIRDFDIYFKNRDTTLAVAKYYLSKFQQKHKEGIPCEMYINDTKTDRVEIVIKSSGIASEEGTKVSYKYFESEPQEQAGEYVDEIMESVQYETSTDISDIQEIYEEYEEKSLAIKDLYKPVFLSTNAITLSDKIQLVLRFFGNPDEIHENYDYVHCTNYWTSWDGQLTLNQKALEALLAKELIYVGSKYPIASLIRMRKFIDRGWRINAGQVLKMSLQISELDLKNYEVLKEQLTGVDVAYFAQLLAALQNKTGDQQDIEYAYVVEIIDRMF